MHETQSALCHQIDSLLAPYGARRLGKKEVELASSGALFGWQLETFLVFKGEAVLINLLFDDEFLDSIPSVAVAKPVIKPCDLPHVETNGKLCVWPDRYIADLNNLNYILELLRDAIELLEKAISGQINEHFEHEFQSYWAYHCNSSISTTSLCDVHKKHSRQVATFHTKRSGVIVADSPPQIEKWLDNQSLLPKNSKKKQRIRALAKIQPSALLYFEDTWLPNQFPHTTKDVFELIRREHGEQHEKILEILAQAFANSTTSNPVILILFNTLNGPCIVSLIFSRGIYDRHNRQSVMDGLRRKISLKDFINRTTNISVTGGIVRRADPDWIMGRDSNPSFKTVSKNKVAIIGCGSIGAAVARLLIQSGLTELIIFDGETLSSENISRHVLGFDSVGKEKASELAYKLKHEFPYITVEAVNKNWQKEQHAMSKLTNADLILSCTADWYSDLKLIKLQSSSCLATIVFSFVEAHALAGHVIVNTLDSDAFNSLHILEGPNVGKMKAPATDWKDETLKKIPACAGEFQPYGVIPLTHLHAVTANTVLSLLMAKSDDDIKPQARTWLGSRYDLEKLGGNWGKEWCSLYGNPNEGNQEISLLFSDGSWSRADA